MYLIEFREGALLWADRTSRAAHPETALAAVERPRPL